MASCSPSRPDDESVASGSLTAVSAGAFFVGDPASPGGVFLTCRDLTGDGVGELITAQGSGGSPEVRIWSLQGNTLIEVARFFAYDPAFTGFCLTRFTCAALAPAARV